MRASAARIIPAAARGSSSYPLRKVEDRTEQDALGMAKALRACHASLPSWLRLVWISMLSLPSPPLAALPTPGPLVLALLYSMEAFARSLMATVIPLQAYALLKDAAS